MRNVLLTGGTGFVGRHVLSHLTEYGCKIRLLARTPQQVAAGVEVVVMEDLFSATAGQLKDLCSDVDTVIHLAWHATPGEYLNSDENLKCLAGTLNFAQAAIVANVQRFVGVGTCFEYDLSAGYLRTSTPLAPTTLYGSCKASAYLALSRLMAREKRSFAWCRLFYLHGEGESGQRLVPYIRAQLANGRAAELTSGTQIRDYLDVREAGNRIALSALSGMEGPLNICSGKPVTIADLAGAIADEYGRRDLLRFGARSSSPEDPPCVFGEPSELSTAVAQRRS